jgi:hypothetical protein
MLLHCFYLFEFKIMFEFNFYELFLKIAKSFSFSFLLLSLLAHHPRSPACFSSRGPPSA